MRGGGASGAERGQAGWRATSLSTAVRGGGGGSSLLNNKYEYVISVINIVCKLALFFFLPYY